MSGEVFEYIGPDPSTGKKKKIIALIIVAIIIAGSVIGGIIIFFGDNPISTDITDPTVNIVSPIETAYTGPEQTLEILATDERYGYGWDVLFC